MGGLGRMLTAEAWSVDFGLLCSVLFSITCTACSIGLEVVAAFVLSSEL